jgi:GTPase SAR1 family protein
MRLAILIIGPQNSGKTSTIKHLIKLYNGKTLTIMKAGWNEIPIHNKTNQTANYMWMCTSETLAPAAGVRAGWIAKYGTPNPVIIQTLP